MPLCLPTVCTSTVSTHARFLNNRLGVAFDWYKKITKDWLVRAPMLLSYGTNAPYVNGGDIENKGYEIQLNWNDRIGKDFKYSVSDGGVGWLSVV